MFHDPTCELDRAVAHIFQVMLARECSPIQELLAAEPLATCLSATVRFSGGVAGWFAILVDQEAAREIAAWLTGLPHEELSTTLASDTVAELCNVIAGNWKSRQPPPIGTCALSPPVLASGGLNDGLSALTRIYSFATHQITLRLSIT